MPSFKIRLASDLNFKSIVLSHGWAFLEPFQWEMESETLYRTDRIGRKKICWSIQAKNNRSLLVSADKKLLNVEQEKLKALARRCLMLDVDLSTCVETAERCNPEIAGLIRSGAGRLLRGSTFFEDVIKTICTINTSWSNSKKMVYGLVQEVGRGMFPSPERVSALKIKDLEKLSVGYRASTLLNVARRMSIDPESGDWTREKLSRIKGLGPYAVNHIMVLNADYSQIPVDSEVMTYCKQSLRMKKAKADDIQKRFSKWGIYRFLGYKLERMLYQNNWIGDE